MKSNSKRRVKKHTNSLRKAPIIEPHSYYISDNNKRLKEIDSLDVRHNGVTFETVVKELGNKQVELIEVKDNVKVCESVLTEFLLSFGYNTPNTYLNALIEDLQYLNIINPSKEYTGYKVVDGYVVGYGYNVICEQTDNQPDDFNKGYWRFSRIDGWLLDEDKFRELWNVVL